VQGFEAQVFDPDVTVAEVDGDAMGQRLGSGRAGRWRRGGPDGYLVSWTMLLRALTAAVKSIVIWAPPVSLTLPATMRESSL